MYADEKDDFTTTSSDNDICNLALGAPGTTTLKECHRILLTSTEEVLKNTENDSAILQYGPLQGDETVREELAKFLSVEYKDNVKSNDLMLTAGATQGLHLTTTVLLSTDTTIFVEDPTYFIAINVFRKDLGYTVIAVPTDDFGVDVDALEALIQNTPAAVNSRSPFKYMLYTMTVFRNPTGTTLPQDRCRKLVALAKKYDVLLFTEDIYNLLHYSEKGSPPPRLLSYDKRNNDDEMGNTLSNCTFSKIMAPGLRAGWIEGSPKLIRMLYKSFTAWSGGSFNHYTSQLIGKALQLGLVSDHLRTVRVIYAERMKRICKKLRDIDCVPVTFTEPQGGFFVWVNLPEYVDVGKLRHTAIESGLIFIDGPSTSPTEGFKNYIRLAISYCDAEYIEKGINKLTELLRKSKKT